MLKLFRYNKETLTFDKIKIKPKVYIFSILILGGIYWLGWVSNIQIVDKIVHHKTIDTVLVHGQPFNEKSLVELIKDCNLKYPHIVLAQAKIESGNFTSKIFRQNNNMFGMRRARIRVTSAQSEKDAFAYYRDWMDCVYDYAMYQTSIMCDVNSEEEYLNKLGEKYAQDSSYVPAIKSLIEREKLRSKFRD
jgi:hypothetical protein